MINGPMPEPGALARIAREHPEWTISEHPEARAMLTAERRRGNEVRYVVAPGVVALLAAIERAEADDDDAIT